MASKNSNPMFFVILFVFVLLIAGLYLFSQEKEEDETLLQANIENPQNTEIVMEKEDDTGEVTVKIDVETAAAERILGNPEAPLRVVEFSSFTCGHCGQFHQKTFKTFKEQWIDTGRAYLVFSDFPLNAPALHASMVARCLPQDKYFDFVQMLFEEQDNWAYDVGYQDFLKEKSAENGLSSEEFSACLKSEELQNAILERVRASQQQFEINATPSFVINNAEAFSGTLSYADFEIQLNNVLRPESPPVENTLLPPPAAPPETVE